MNEKNLIKYYNKFNEAKRLNSKHGNIEFITAMKYIKKYLKKDDKIIDIGAGCGKYTLSLYDEGYNIEAVELVKHNLKVIEKKNKNIKLYNLNALDLSKIKDESYDITLLFGPMYHLIDDNDKIKALNEAKRITKSGGYIFVSYCLNEFAIIKHGFIDNNILNCSSLIDNKFKIKPNKEDLYSFVRLDDINYFNKVTNLNRVKIVSQDGPTEYIKKVINKMDDKTYDLFIKYHFSTCERKELLGAGRHVLDILKK